MGFVSVWSRYILSTPYQISFKVLMKTYKAKLESLNTNVNIHL